MGAVTVSVSANTILAGMAVLTPVGTWIYYVTVAAFRFNEQRKERTGEVTELPRRRRQA